MLKQIKIGGQERPIQFGYSAKRRLDPILRKMASETEGDSIAKFAQLATNIEFQIQLLKIGLEEGERIQSQKVGVESPIHETTICDWIDERPEVVYEAITVYTDQMLTIQAKQNGEDPGEFKARVMGTASNTKGKASGTPSNASAVDASDLASWNSTT
jgi:hypothetical protein